MSTGSFQPNPPGGHALADTGTVPSPALVIHPERVEENIRRMIAIAGDPERLRPHVKTHKLAEIVRLQRDAGIRRFKCATLAEAAMAAAAGAPDVLLAVQPVGPNIGRLVRLASANPGTAFSAVVDDESVLRDLESAARSAGVVIPVFIDLDTGMHRTGIAPGEAAGRLARLADEGGSITLAGLHAYDGHVTDRDVAARTERCDREWLAVEAFARSLEGAGIRVAAIVAGGTPTFPIHARRSGVECSPGTCLLWDAGYASGLPDLDFLHAAFLLARVISRPGNDRLCLDLGHKAVAAENPLERRVRLVDLPGAAPVGQSEEHLVVETPDAASVPVGSVVWGVPWHVCPTVALHDEAFIVRGGEVADRWPIVARTRRCEP